jgi:ATP-dependent RNA/DNA helicase IGHMBP2
MTVQYPPLKQVFPKTHPTYLCTPMEYFKRLQHLLKIEKEEDRRSFKELTEKMPVQDRRENGMTWYPIAIKDTEIGQGDYITVEVERTTHQDIMHQLRFGMSAALFSNHNAKADRVEGTITHISGNRLKLSLRTDELPDWSRNGKLGIDAVFDENSYSEMENALKLAPLVAEKKQEGKLVRILTGEEKPGGAISNQQSAREFDYSLLTTSHSSPQLQTTHHKLQTALNASQLTAVQQILSTEYLAIVHGPPGTGKTTTLVQAIKLLVKREGRQILVTAPSNAAVDLLTLKLSDEGLNTVRVGNPARVSEKLMSLTLDHKIAAHSSAKEIKRLRKQASDYRDMAQKYKRSFGPAEREQRKALFAEARNLMKEVERTEQYITEDVLSKAQIITATLVGANHYTVRNRKYHTVVIDEAAQAIEPACWIPVLKAEKLIMAGDHLQLPPSIKSAEAAKEGLAKTLMQKCVALHPETVVLLEEQYRMHQTIMGFSSKEFYGNRLQAHPSVAQHLLFPGDKALLFIDTAGCGFEEKQEGSGLANPEEAQFLLKHLIHFTKELSAIYTAEAFPSIGVIAPYRHQVELLKETVASHPDLENFLHAITVNTIDSFQGQERDVIYISLTRSNSDSTIGFLSELRRTNVALTRARKKLVVLGDSATLSGFPFYADLIHYAQEHGAYASAWEFMDV